VRRSCNVGGVKFLHRTVDVALDSARLTEVAVDALAVYRLTRLVTADTITERPRGAIIRDAYQAAGKLDDEYIANLPLEKWTAHVAHDDDAPYAARFITCPWCASPYIALGVVMARRYIPQVWHPIALVFAFSGVAGLASSMAE
jgi:hypothetical protein